MLRGDNLARYWLEPGTDFAAPCAVFEAPAFPRSLLNRCNVLPSLVVARTITMVQCVKDPKLSLARGIQNLQHVRNAAVRLCDSLDARPYLAALGNEVVIWIDHQKCGDLLVICMSRHG